MSAWERAERIIAVAIVILCAEADPAECHRTEVAEALVAILTAAGIEAEVKHLGVPE